MSRVLTDEILSVVATGTGRQIGDGTAPAAPLLPYAVLYPLPSPTHDGDLTSPDRDRGWVYQVTAVGATRDQAEWMADKVQTSMEDDTFAPVGITVMNIEATLGPGVERDDDTGTVTAPGDTATSYYYAPATYEFWTTR